MSNYMLNDICIKPIRNSSSMQRRSNKTANYSNHVSAIKKIILLLLVQFLLTNNQICEINGIFALSRT